MHAFSRRWARRLGHVLCFALAWAWASAAPAADPIRIGFSMALTGGIAANGKAALLAIRMWADDVNARGGLLGRPVELVYYDDQSNPSTVPGIYTKLIDVDKVQLVVSPYGTNLIAPAMPVVMGRGMTMMSLFGVGVNKTFNYDRYFQIMPMGPDSDAAIGTAFFDVAMTLTPKPRTVALTGADAEFGKVVVDAARQIAKQRGLQVVYDRAYPPATVDFTPIVRAIQAARPDLVFVGSYPTDSVGMVRAASELGLKTMLFGGGTVGLQYAAIKTQLGPLLNGVVSYELYVPSPKLQFAGIEDFVRRYQPRAAAEGVDPLGYYVPPFVYAAMQVLGQAVERTGSLDQKALAERMHKEAFPTIAGEIRFAANGEWDKPRVLLVQYRDVASNALDEFRRPDRQVVLYPPEYKSGDVSYPFEGGRR